MFIVYFAHNSMRGTCTPRGRKTAIQGRICAGTVDFGKTNNKHTLKRWDFIQLMYNDKIRRLIKKHFSYTRQNN